MAGVFKEEPAGRAASVKPRFKTSFPIEANVAAGGQSPVIPQLKISNDGVEKLIGVLHRLVNGGHSVVVIKHDLDVISEADWVIDLGPDGGNVGGSVVAAAPPETVVKLGTHTGNALRGVSNQV